MIVVIFVGAKQIEVGVGWQKTVVLTLNCDGCMKCECCSANCASVPGLSGVYSGLAPSKSSRISTRCCGLALLIEEKWLITVFIGLLNFYDSYRMKA